MGKPMIIPIDLAVASLTAEYRDIGLSGNDSLIAATGLALVNPWEFGK